MKRSKQSIIIVDDHPVIHDGLKILLASEKYLSIEGFAISATEAEKLLKSISVDIAIIDLSLGDSDGTYLIQKISQQFPSVRILVYSMSEERLFGERVANAGAYGYVMKTSGPATLKKALRTITNGDIFFSPDIKKRILKKKTGRKKESRTPLDNLSNREMDIFKLVGQGINSADIASKLNISRNTVDTHRINIKNKLNLENGKELDRFAYEVIQQGNLPS